MLKIFSLILSIILVSPSVAKAHDVIIGIGEFEPYFIEESHSGIFTDIINAVFEYMPHHTPIYEYGHSVKTLVRQFEAGRIAALANLFSLTETSGCKSDPVFRFRDVAITRKRDFLTINSIDDLLGKSIVAFEGAGNFFGEGYSAVTQQNNYLELGNQYAQMDLLYKGRADVSIGDMYIFLQSIKNSQLPSVKPTDFVFHNIFPQISSTMGFHEKAMCNEFNVALKKVRKSGEYEDIFSSYLIKLGYK